MRVVIFIAVFVLVCAVNGRPSKDDDDYDLNVAEPEPGIQNDNTYDYDGVDDEDLEPEIPEPILATRPQDFTAKENQTVHLPCDIENGDTLVSMWKKNNDIIFQDTIKFNSFGNNFQIHNRTLIISNVGANETANYTCLIPLSKTEYLSVTHQLFVQTAPKIVSLRALHDVLQLDAGQTLVLTCKAIGFPVPKIKWSKKGQRLSAEGETVTIENISHHDSGDYQCLADNNIEPPAHQFIHISVVHRPIVKIEKLTVNADQGLDSQLICYVHAVPRADVLWKKDGINIISSDRKHVKHHNHTYVLEITKVQPEDFGIYTCSAYNRVGRSEKNITLTGYPSPAKHIRTYHDPQKNIVISWNVESNSPIIKYSLEYKKLSDSEWKAVSPDVTNPEGNLYTVNYTFANLTGGHYETKLRSLNSYGWSDYSVATSFKNGGHHHHRPEHKQEKPETNDLTKGTVEEHPQFPFDSAVDHSGKPHTTQTPDPLLAVPEVPKEDKTEQKPHTQEHQHQAGNGKGDNDAAAGILPMLSLLCIALFSTIYSR